MIRFCSVYLWLQLLEGKALLMLLILCKVYHSLVCVHFITIYFCPCLNSWFLWWRINVRGTKSTFALTKTPVFVLSLCFTPALSVIGGRKAPKLKIKSKEITSPDFETKKYINAEKPLISGSLHTSYVFKIIRYGKSGLRKLTRDLLTEFKQNPSKAYFFSQRFIIWFNSDLRFESDVMFRLTKM